MDTHTPFKWRHFESEIILLCVRWYLRYSLSSRDLEEMMLERGLQVDHTTIYRSRSALRPGTRQTLSAPSLQPVTTPGAWMKPMSKSEKTGCTSTGQSIPRGTGLPFLLSPTRDAEAAKRFFVKALHVTAGSASRACPTDEKEALRSTEPATCSAASGASCAGIRPNSLSLRAAPRSVPRVINVDKHAAYPKAIADLKASGTLPESVELRQVKYLNNLIEQDHRFIKRLVKPGMGFFSVETAGRTRHRYEVMRMLRKGQVRGVGKGDIHGQVSFIASLFGVAA